MALKRISLFLIIALTFFFSKESHAQTIFISPNEIDENNFDNIKIIGQDDDGVFLLESNLPFELDRDRVGFKSRKFKAAYFSNDLGIKWVKQFEAMPANAIIQAVTCSQEKILIVSAIDSKSQNILSIYGQWMNNKGEIVKNKEIGTIAFENRNDVDKAKLITSANQQFTGVLIHEYNDGSKQTLHLLLMDSANNLVGNKNFVINYSAKNFITTGYSLSNKGDFHLIGVRTMKDKNAERKKQEDFVLFSAPADSSRFSEFFAGNANTDVTNASINFDNINNKIVCAGFYSDRASTTGAGVIYATIDMNNPTQMVVKANPVEVGTKIKVLGGRNRASGTELTDYPVEKIILRSDGGAVIVAEASYTNDYSYYDYFTQSYTSRTEFHYNNIIIVSVNADASIAWLDVVNKNQESEDDGGAFSSFCPLLTSDELILIYNSDISRNSEVLGARISNTGGQTESHVSRATDHLLLFSRNGKQVSENEVIVPCISKKKMTLAKITY
jgi:hypothetical protein